MTPPLPVAAHDGFRRRLQQELAERCSRNPRYSLRAFALWLRVDHSTLTQLIRGIRPITPATVGCLGVRLGLDRVEVDGYLTGSMAIGPVDGATLSDAILRLVGRPGFRPDSRWIARTLGVTSDDVNSILWEIKANNQLGYRMVDTVSDQGIPGGIWPAPPAAPTFVQLFVEVGDVSATVERTLELGGSVLIPPQRLPDGDTMAILRDPQGLTFGVTAPV